MYFIQDQKSLQIERRKMEDKWKVLNKEAQKKYNKFVEPLVPYHDGHVVGKFNGLDNGNINNNMM